MVFKAGLQNSLQSAFPKVQVFFSKTSMAAPIMYVFKIASTSLLDVALQQKIPKNCFDKDFNLLQKSVHKKL